MKIGLNACECVCFEWNQPVIQFILAFANLGEASTKHFFTLVPRTQRTHTTNFQKSIYTISFPRLIFVVSLSYYL